MLPLHCSQHCFVPILCVFENAHFQISPTDIHSAMTSIDFNDDTLKYCTKCIPARRSNKQTVIYKLKADRKNKASRKLLFPLKVRQQGWFV